MRVDAQHETRRPFLVRGETMKIFFSVVARPKSGKNLRRKIQQSLQVRPVEARARVLFATGGNVFVPGNVRDGVVAEQVLAQLGQTPVLGLFKSVTFQALEFDAD